MRALLFALLTFAVLFLLGCDKPTEPYPDHPLIEGDGFSVTLLSSSTNEEARFHVSWTAPSVADDQAEISHFNVEVREDGEPVKAWETPETSSEFGLPWPSGGSESGAMRVAVQTEDVLSQVSEWALSPEFRYSRNVRPPGPPGNVGVEGDVSSVWIWPYGPIEIDVGETVQLCGFGRTSTGVLFMDANQIGNPYCLERYNFYKYGSGQ